jgi:CRISPR system Cascade subunit CasA
VRFNGAGAFDAPQRLELEEALMPLAAAFEWDAEGARFMQDFDLRASDGEPVGIAALLIESPGENTVKNNSDLFVKRGHVQALCDHCAALALFTLQLNAPSVAPVTAPGCAAVGL